MEGPTDHFLCKMSDNVYKIDFCRYKIRDMDSKIVLVDINHEDFEDSKSELPEEELPDEERLIRYKFGPDFLEFQTIGTELEFKVGELPVKNLVMIERHYFKGKLIKSYDFNVNFCIPGTTNAMEAIYDLPELTEEEKEDIRSSPWEVKADSFFFVDGRLVIHTRSEYDYSPFE